MTNYMLESNDPQKVLNDNVRCIERTRELLMHAILTSQINVDSLGPHHVDLDRLDHYGQHLLRFHEWLGWYADSFRRDANERFLGKYGGISQIDSDA